MMSKLKDYFERGKPQCPAVAAEQPHAVDIDDATPADIAATPLEQLPPSMRLLAVWASGAI